MLTEEVIKNNFERFVKGLESSGIEMNNSKLLEKYGLNIMISPASKTTEMHGAYKGGLVEHILSVASYAIKLNNLLPDEHKIEQKSLLKVAFLHQLSICEMFTPQLSDWHIQKGILYEYTKDRVAMHVGEKSAKMALDNGIELTDHEFQAMINFTKENDDQAKYFTETIGELIKMANTLAIKTSKNK